MIKKFDDFINEDVYIHKKRTKKQLNGLIQQTADSYALSFGEVERVFYKNYDPETDKTDMNFYDELEYILKNKRK